jgi:hypothetical protein
MDEVDEKLLSILNENKKVSLLELKLLMQEFALSCCTHRMNIQCKIDEIEDSLNTDKEVSTLRETAMYLEGERNAFAVSVKLLGQLEIKSEH